VMVRSCRPDRPTTATTGRLRAALYRLELDQFHDDWHFEFVTSLCEEREYRWIFQPRFPFWPSNSNSLHKTWSLTSLQQRLVKTGGRLIKHARYYWLMLAESHLTRRLFAGMLRKITMLPAPGTQEQMSPESMGKQHLQPSAVRQTRNRPLPALLGTLRNKID
jgi:hypothetical protein